MQQVAPSPYSTTASCAGLAATSSASDALAAYMQARVFSKAGLVSAADVDVPPLFVGGHQAVMVNPALLQGGAWASWEQQGGAACGGGPGVALAASAASAALAKLGAKAAGLRQEHLLGITYEARNGREDLSSPSVFTAPPTELPENLSMHFAAGSGERQDAYQEGVARLRAMKALHIQRQLRAFQML